MVATAPVRDKRHGGPRCYKCGYTFPPGADTCMVCGYVWLHRGDPYPAASVDRYDWVDAQHVGDPVAKEVLAKLVSHDRGNNRTPGTVNPSVARIAVMVERSAATVYRKLELLEREGWVEREHDHQPRGWRAPNRYTIRSPFHSPTSHAANSNLAESPIEGVDFEGVKARIEG